MSTLHSTNEIHICMYLKLTVVFNILNVTSSYLYLSICNVPAAQSLGLHFDVEQYKNKNLHSIHPRVCVYVKNSKLIQRSSLTLWFTLFFFKTLHVSATNYSTIIRCFNNTIVKGTRIYKVFQTKQKV